MNIAEQAREEAIRRVSRPLTDEEKFDALLKVGLVAEKLQFFTTDDIPFNFPSHVDSRASGYIMRQAAKERFIRPTDRFCQSSQEDCHARPKRVWESMILEGE